MYPPGERGRLAAQVLYRTWRDETGPVDTDIDAVLAASLASAGSLGLLGRRLQYRPDDVALQAVSLWQGQTVHAVLQGRIVAGIVTALHTAGIEPVLLKGLAAARHYPMVGARPSGDIDLLVSPGDFSRANAVLQEIGFVHAWSGHAGWVMLMGPDGIVDLQTGLWPLDNSEATQAMDSNDRFTVEGVQVRVPPPELEIRFLAIHAAKHAFLRPLWLCDVAAVIERSSALHWHRVLSGPWHVRSWVMGAIGVAERLLGLEVPTEVHSRCIDAATWIDPFVLRRWGTGATPTVTPEALADALFHQRSVRALLQCVRQGWPDPLHVVTHRGWPLNRPLAYAALLLAASTRAFELGRHRPHLRKQTVQRMHPPPS